MADTHWQGRKAPLIPLHDDNRGMIGVARTGRNPTMRHLERTHGISIVSLREHFQRDHFVLLYMRFPTRCVLTFIQRLSGHHSHGAELVCLSTCLILRIWDLKSWLTWSPLKRRSQDNRLDHHMFQTKTDDIPNFPYTQTPVLPRAVFHKGMAGQEGVQDLPTGDCICMSSRSPSTIVVIHQDDSSQQMCVGAPGYLSMVCGIESKRKRLTAGPKIRPMGRTSMFPLSCLEGLFRFGSWCLLIPVASSRLCQCPNSHLSPSHATLLSPMIDGNHSIIANLQPFV